MSPIIIELLVAGVLFGILIGGFAVGARLGRVRATEQQDLGVIQGATLGFLGLLIGFCFSGAMSRFVDRQDIEVREANALGTAWLRADLLDPLSRDELHALLREYTQERIRLTESSRTDESAQIVRRLDGMQQQIWSVAIRGVEQRPATMVGVLPPVNEVFDMLGTRNAAARRHLPTFAVVLVFISVILGSMLLGYGRGGKRLPIRVAALCVVVVIGGMIWATIDLDFPQHGLIQISSRSLRAALDSMPPASGPQ